MATQWAVVRSRRKSTIINLDGSYKESYTLSREAAGLPLLAPAAENVHVHFPKCQTIALKNPCHHLCYITSMIFNMMQVGYLDMMRYPPQHPCLLPSTVCWQQRQANMYEPIRLTRQAYAWIMFGLGFYRWNMWLAGEIQNFFSAPLCVHTVYN